MKMDLDDTIFHYLLIGIGLFAGSMLKSAAELADRLVLQKLKAALKR